MADVRNPRSYRHKIIKPVQLISNKRLILPGMIIWFKYNEVDINDPQPIIMVLWQEVVGRRGGNNLIHGINLNYLKFTEIKKLFSLLESKFETGVIEPETDQAFPSEPYTKVALPGEFNKRVKPSDKIKLQKVLYERTLKPKFKRLDVSFRSYKIRKMTYIRLVNFDYK
jgi:hypothetical protein